MKRYSKITFLLSLVLFFACAVQAQKKQNPYYSRSDNAKLNISDAAWKKILPAGVYQVAREKATEQAYTGEYWNNHKKGMYYCAVCGHPLFSSKTKFDSGTGWPSFYEALSKNSVKENEDGSDGMVRTEVVCARCGSHLGHVFNDGPAPTHLRYCMNSAVLDFVAEK